MKHRDISCSNKMNSIFNPIITARLMLTIYTLSHRSWIRLQKTAGYLKNWCSSILLGSYNIWSRRSGNLHFSIPWLKSLKAFIKFIGIYIYRTKIEIIIQSGKPLYCILYNIGIYHSVWQFGICFTFLHPSTLQTSNSHSNYSYIRITHLCSIGMQTR